VLTLVGILSFLLCTAAPPASSKPGIGSPRVGLLCALSCGSAHAEVFRSELTNLHQRGSSIVYVERSADGDLARLAHLARELVDERVDVIFTTWGTAAGLAAKHATATTPIVVGSAGDLVAAGIVASLNKPGANVTGISSLALDLEAKRLEVLKQLAPGVRAVAAFGDPTNPYSALAIAEQRRAAESLGFVLKEIPVRDARDVGAAFAIVAKEHLEAVVLHGYVPILVNRDLIVGLATTNRVVAIYPSREFVEAGGLVSYGASLRENARRAAVQADKILKGSKPADLPVEQSTKIELVINLNTAKALGITIPPTLLARADEVIE
jgi:putative ABC transport system substrate-binding protein